MKLTVATNWDVDLIKKLSDYPVYDVYGVTDHSVVGGGRPSVILPKIKQEKIADYIKMVHDYDMQFTYLLNAPCMNNMEYNPEIHKKLLEQLNWIVDIGSDGVVVTTPFLVELIKEQYPQLNLRVSVIAHVNSVNRAKLYEQLGADEITVDMNINRDFITLEKMVKATGCKLNVLLTDGCLFQCPFRYYHYNILGHASQTYQQFNRDYIDFCIVNCSIIKFSQPEEVMKCRWVRPEDLTHYEDIGIDHFKIAGRRMPTDWILRSVKAFSDREYKGNLVDIIQGFSMTYGGLHEKDPASGLAKSIDSEGKARIYIDNTKLDGFIDFFKKQNCYAMCDECNYCKKWAEKTVTYNKIDAESYVTSLKDYNHDIISSKVFGAKRGEKDSNEDGSTSQFKPSMPWNGKTIDTFEKLVMLSPPQFQQIARMVISGLAEKKARERNSNQDDDMVKAFLEGTPGPFQPDMHDGLKKYGFNHYLE